MRSLTPSRLFLVLAAALCSTGCGGSIGPDPQGISAETFVEVWADLRIAALERPGLPITPADRERILATHEVTEESLLQFAEEHGDDLELMQRIMNLVQARVRDRPGQAADGDPGSSG